MRIATLALLLLACPAFGQTGIVRSSPPPAEQPPAPTPPEAGPQDTRNASSKVIGERIKSANVTVLALSDDLLKPVAMARKADRLKELRRIEELRKGFKMAMISVLLLEETCSSLDRELHHATKSYDSVASGFRDRAEDYSDSKLRESCLALAAHYETLRDKCPEHRKALDELRGQIPGLLKLVKETGLFLDDIALFTSSYAEEKVPDDVVKQHTDAIQAYAKSFERYEQSLKQYRDSRKSP
jgi:hypothetical protein